MTNLLPNGGYTEGKPEYPKSMPALGTTQTCDRSIPVEQVGPLRVTVAGIEGTFVLPEVLAGAVITLNDYSVDPAYAALFEHRSGCSSTRGRDCTCEYLGQWDA